MLLTLRNTFFLTSKTKLTSLGVIERLDVRMELMLEPVFDSLDTRSVPAADRETVSTESSTSEPGTAVDWPAFAALAEVPRAGGSDEGTGGGFREVTVVDEDDPLPVRLEI